MALDLDGLAVLASMAGRPDAFAGIEADAAKVAHTLLTKLLKDEATTLSDVRAMASALLDGTLAHVTDGVTDAGLATCLRRLNPDLKTADHRTRVKLVANLVSGVAKPVRGEKAAVPKGSPAKEAPSIGVEAVTKVLKSKAIGDLESRQALMRGGTVGPQARALNARRAAATPGAARRDGGGPPAH